jgi:pimeloyl-ACP methyl ester carboxylesterase
LDGTLVLRRYAPVLALAGGVGLWRAVAPAHDPAALASAEARALRHLQRPHTHRYVQAGQHQIHTLVMGEGPPLVMLHGHGGGVGVWLYNLDVLARHFRVYAVDWLGWGRSERPQFTGRTSESARNWWLNSLEDWRQAMGLADFILLGHSLGGWLAAEYAMRYARHVQRLILVNAAGIVEDVTYSRSLFYYVSPQRMVQAVGVLGPRLVAYGCSDQMERCPYDGVALLEYYYWLSRAPLSGQVAFERILTPRRWCLPLLPRADRLTVPTTILWGMRDQLLWLNHALEYQSCLPNSRLVLLPDGAHSPHSEDPGRFNEEVVKAAKVAYPFG